jgi:cell division protein FtsI/penicillin-binding protein 2
MAALAVSLGLLTSLVACASTDDGSASVVRAFLAGWASGKLDALSFEDSTGAPMDATAVAQQMKDLAGDLDLSRINVSAAGSPSVTGADATAPVNVTWPITTATAGHPQVVWRYQTTVRLQRVPDAWRVVWSPDTLHPMLHDGDTLALTITTPPRASILDGDSDPIMSLQPVVVVGIEPQLVTDQTALLAALDTAFRSAGVQVDLSGLPAQIAAARPDAFVEVVTLRESTYVGIAAQIHDLPGTVFQRATMDLAPSHDFARALLGTVGEVRRDQMDAHPGVYRVGDQAGQGGLEEQFDASLRGADGATVSIPGHDDTGQATPGITVFTSPPRPGTAVATTLDQAVQNAADKALSTQSNPSALVAIRVADGHILAVANGPAGGGVDLALTAAVPPGSTFKVVTALAALNAGYTPDSLVACPKTYTVAGRTFTNENMFDLGNVPLHTDFAKSCNTAFASLGAALPAAALTQTAAALGIGQPWNLGVDAYTGSVPLPPTPIDQAAAAFGQGQTQVSPLAMAGVAAAVARGGWQQPVLFTRLPPGATPSPSKSAAATGPDLSASLFAQIRPMMAEVVTSGTATGLAAVPGGPVYAKTGTAEYDNDPTHAHSWVIGYQNGIAFAVFVQNGGSSAAAAVPAAAAFLTALATNP